MRKDQALGLARNRLQPNRHLPHQLLQLATLIRQRKSKYWRMRHVKHSGMEWKLRAYSLTEQRQAAKPPLMLQ